MTEHIFGDPAAFCIFIERNVDKTQLPWLYGKFHMCINGIVIGNQCIEHTISDLIMPFEWLLSTRKERACKSLMKEDSRSVLFTLESSIYGSDHLGEIPFISTEIPNPERFELTPLEGLDDYKIYGFESDGLFRIVYTRDYKSTGEFTLESSNFYSVVERALSMLNSWRCGS